MLYNINFTTHIFEPQKDDQYEAFLNDFSDTNIDHISPTGREPSAPGYYNGAYADVEYNDKFELYGEDAG